MDVFALTERLMRMDDATWERHANPLSVWSRVAALPLLAFSVWTRVWIGWWCLLPIAAVALFVFVNPRLFAPPVRRDSWAARATFGERLFLARTECPVPAGHERPALLLTGVSIAGIVPLAYGLAVLEPWATLFGLALAMGGKLWFCDRMVWFYEDMRGRPDEKGRPTTRTGHS
ncbi:DUF6653 family protein [Jiella avicenniae]|uniref:Uncharacterized protein n=1 Tax=Jiella avicenniae TaxID=2907202 RepID=A0A9X1T4D0_9HYPH|nr:DUF6653 family protein [Jiella avicenniae]MCE7028406.1 hypothetical protein [Jiella avicenniae]